MVRDKLTFCSPISVIIAKRQSRGGQYVSDMAAAEQICATLTTEGQTRCGGLFIPLLAGREIKVYILQWESSKFNLFTMSYFLIGRQNRSKY